MIEVLALALGQVALAPGDDVNRLRTRSQPVLDRFYSAVVACGARPPFKPTIAASDTPGIIHYDQAGGRLVLYPWTVADAATRAEHAQKAKLAGQSDGGRDAYEATFYELLVAHELGHWLQGFQPELRTSAGAYDDWTAEYNANQIMIAFWRENAGVPGMGEKRLESWIKADLNTKNAVPAPTGIPVQEFFNAQRMTIVRGGAYGWYQMDMTRKALAEQPNPRFCDLVSRWLPLR